MRASGLVAYAPEASPGAEDAQTVSVVLCPRDRVGRVIGRGGETIKALQLFSGATIQIDQSKEPTEITLLGSSGAVSLAQSMIEDIINGAFKGFAMLRQTAFMLNDPLAPSFDPPLYVPRYGFVARNQIEGSHSMQPGGFPMGPQGPLLGPLTPEKLPGWMPGGQPPPAPPQPRIGGAAAGSSGAAGGAAGAAGPGMSSRELGVQPGILKGSVPELEEVVVPVSNPSSLSEMVAAMQIQPSDAAIPGSARSLSASSRRTEPKEVASPEGAAFEGGSEWVQVPNPDGRIFFHNRQTGESRWGLE